MGSSSLVLGVDSSTQSTKVEVRRVEDGAVVASARVAHPPTTPPVSEQQPTDWWWALAAACADLGDVRDDVEAIAVAGQQHGLVLLDGHGETIRPAPLWNDTTAAGAADRLVAALGPEAWAAGCGSVPTSSFTVAKLAHLLATEPDLVGRATKIMLPHDYLTWRLTDAHVTDRGDASGTGWFDPSSDTYRRDLLAAAVGADDVDTWLDRLPVVLGRDGRAGELTETAADALGLPAGIDVGPGTGDNMAAALGLGLGPGDTVMSLGTSGTVYASSVVATADPTGAVAGFAGADGGHLPLVCTLNATRVTDTVAGWLGTDPAGLGALALEAGVAPSDVVLVPYFDGERTPNRPTAAGSFHGLRTGTSREQLARAAHDGVLCGLLDGRDALQAAGVSTDGGLLLIGGGARSEAYRQRCADLHGAPIRVPESDEVVATGAAVQAAALLDAVPLAEIAQRWCLGHGPTVEPRPGAGGGQVRARYTAIVAAGEA